MGLIYLLLVAEDEEEEDDCAISEFSRGVNKICALLALYAV
jgi:hypothetical protein